METQIIGHFKNHTALLSAVSVAQNAALNLWQKLSWSRMIREQYVHTHGEPVRFGKYIVAVGGVRSAGVRDFIALTCLVLIMYRDVYGKDMPYEILSDYDSFVEVFEDVLKELSSEFLCAYGFYYDGEGESPHFWPGIARGFTTDMSFQTGVAFRNQNECNATE